MKQFIFASLAVLGFQSAYGHAFQFSGDKDSNAGVVYQGMVDASATDTTVIFKKGHYGNQVSKEDEIAAIYCNNLNEKLEDDKGTFTCTTYMKHGDELGPLISYPLGSNIDPYGDANSASALVFKILKARAGIDVAVEVTSLPKADKVERGTDESTLACELSKADGSVKCRFEN